MMKTEQNGAVQSCAMRPQPRRRRVVMAVNNPATTDNRVVKSAQLLVQAGYECHVVGLQREGFKENEEINGVYYHRVRRGPRYYDLLLGFCPQLAPWLLRSRIHSPRNAARAAFSNRRLPYLPANFLQPSLVYPLRTFLRHHSSRVLPWFLGGLILLPSLPLICGYLAFKVARSVGRNSPSGLFRRIVRALQEHHWHSWLVGQLRSHGQHLKQHLRHYQFQIRKVLQQRQQPALYPTGVSCLQGQYLNAFYPQLVQLQADVYHAHELWLLESCVLAAQYHQARVVYDSHEFEAHRNLLWPDICCRQRLRYEKCYIHHADAVLTVSPGCAQGIAQQYGLAQVHILPNCPLYPSTHSSTDLRAALQLDPQVPLIVYTGSATFHRGLEIMLQALLRLPDYVFVTVGSAHPQIKARLQTYSRAWGLHSRFYMHPRVDPEILIPFISSADLAVIPIQNVCRSYYHCLPNKLFEAMFAGLPVVVSDFPDMRHFVQQHAIGQSCDCSDAHALARAIEQVYQQRTQYYNAPKLSRLRRTYCFEQQGQVLLELYQELGKSRVPAKD